MDLPSPPPSVHILIICTYYFLTKRIDVYDDMTFICDQFHASGFVLYSGQFSTSGLDFAEGSTLVLGSRERLIDYVLLSGVPSRHLVVVC
jgi:hypothetical protein